MQNYALSIKIQPHLPNYIIDDSQDEIYNLRPTITKPLTARLDRHIIHIDIYSKSHSSYPPWQFETPIQNLECTTYLKRERNLLGTHFLNILPTYSGATIISPTDQKMKMV